MTVTRQPAPAPAARTPRVAPTLFVVLVTIAGLLSGGLSGFASTLPFETLPRWLPPFLPGFLYGGLTGVCLAVLGAAPWRRAIVFAGAMMVTWAIGLNLAPLTCEDWLTGGGLGCTLYSAGLMGGFAGSLGVAAVAAALFPALRRAPLLIILVAVGTAAGALLELGPYWVFCGWQAATNAILGYGFTHLRSQVP